MSQPRQCGKNMLLVPKALYCSAVVINNCQ